MENRQQMLELMDEQCRDYRAMYRLSQEQKACIEREDIAALETTFAPLKGLMDAIRLRQARMAPLPAPHLPEVEERLQVMRRLLVELDALRQTNQRACEKLLENTRREIHSLGQGRRAAKGYAKPGVQQAQLYDGTR